MENNKSWYVYMHTNKINNKKYIGITGQERYWRRWYSNGSGYKTQIFGRAINKYGWDNFEHEILDIVDNENDALLLEQYYINKYKSNNSKYGYNISSGGIGTDTGIYNLPSKSVPVYQYNLDGIFIAEYPSIMEAERQTGINNASICSCCKGMHSYAKDFIWSYEKYDKIDGIDKKLFRYETTYKKQEKPVYQYDLNGIFIASYKSLSHASKVTGINFKYISACCLGSNGRKSAKGYMWFYEYKGDKIQPHKSIKS